MTTDWCPFCRGACKQKSCRFWVDRSTVYPRAWVFGCTISLACRLIIARCLQDAAKTGAVRADAGLALREDDAP